MSFPIPPTENLYKFAAIAGLVVVIGTQFIFWSTLREYWQRHYEVRPQLAAIRLETQRSDERRDKIQRAIESTKDPATQERLRAQEAREEEVINALRVRIVEVEAKVALLAKFSDWVTLTMVLSSACGGFGLTFSGWGFFRWYWRVQVYQDRAMKGQ